ncbi:hypothetical protein VNO77_43433 [Canavalia gladiata]|uniref:Dymeclin n=1 Tax=Canavalia gladiata TaxID=3824 RepID=A0AAN9JX34_CANGL
MLDYIFKEKPLWSVFHVVFHVSRDVVIQSDRKNVILKKDVLGDQTTENLVTRNVLNFITRVEVSPKILLLHQELISFMIMEMSTQLLYGPPLAPSDVNPFLDATVIRNNSPVDSVDYN